MFDHFIMIYFIIRVRAVRRGRASSAVEDGRRRGQRGSVTRWRLHRLGQGQWVVGGAREAECVAGSSALSAT
jgi:hypothetical protein